jgi:hypothetical protein
MARILEAGLEHVAVATIPLVPAEAGTQGDMRGPAYLTLDSRLRGYERIMV